MVDNDVIFPCPLYRGADCPGIIRTVVCRVCSAIIPHTNPDGLGRLALDLVLPPEVTPICRIFLYSQTRELLIPLEAARTALTGSGLDRIPWVIDTHCRFP